MTQVQSSLERIPVLSVQLNWMNSEAFCNTNINNNITVSTDYVLVALLMGLMDYFI